MMFNNLLEALLDRKATVGVVGLGYVGLPLCVTLSARFNVTGFDINSGRVDKLLDGVDVTGEVNGDALKSGNLEFTSNPESLRDTKFIIVCVPTPIDSEKRPDLKALFSASQIIGERMQAGSIIVYESTVYPGVTEEEMVPVLEKHSGLKLGSDFGAGYSPERINPGDKEHTVERIVKVISASDSETLDIVEGVYGAVITAGVHRAPSIKVAESAKVIENIQRDLNIALMNELAIIFDLAGVDTEDVLKAAGTKWNFLNFKPGLVGGHCIGVDPYYLTSKAEQLGYHPHVILSGRRINDGMGEYIAGQVVKHLIHAGIQVKGARIGVLGLTFKEDVPDIRNSHVPGILAQLKNAGMEVIAHDPIADPDEVKEKLGLTIAGYDEMKNLDAVVIAVGHREYIERGAQAVESMLTNKKGAVIDVKSLFHSSRFGGSVSYWRL